MKEPLMVLISDIHFNIKNLELSSAALQKAINEAEKLNVPLIIAGDLNDTKAIIRAEVANRLIELIRAATNKVYIIVGNHDLINEKGVEHSLNFLSPYAKIIDTEYCLLLQSLTRVTPVICFPYSSQETIQKALSFRSQGELLIMHQGFHGAFLGDYVQDKTSISPELVKDFKVFSGHYHRHQNVGTVTYIGSPYTMSFGEANDGFKGFLVVYDDGTYEQKVLNLRKHVKFTMFAKDSISSFLQGVNKNDLIWITVKGNTKELENFDVKETLLQYNYKLDLVTDENPIIEQLQEINNIEFTDAQKFDMLINEQHGKDADELKNLWKSLI